MSTKAVGEKPSTFKTKSMAILLEKQLPSKMGGKNLGQENSTVSLPSASALFNGKSGMTSAVDSKVSSKKGDITLELLKLPERSKVRNGPFYQFHCNMKVD